MNLARVAIVILFLWSFLKAFDYGAFDQKQGIEVFTNFTGGAVSFNLLTHRVAPSEPIDNGIALSVDTNLLLYSVMEIDSDSITKKQREQSKNILEAHRISRTEYFNGNPELNVISSGARYEMMGNRLFYFWFLDTAQKESKLNTVPRNLQITTVVGDLILIWITPVEKEEDEVRIVNWLSKIVSTLKVYAKPFIPKS